MTNSTGPVKYLQNKQLNNKYVTYLELATELLNNEDKSCQTIVSAKGHGVIKI